MILTASGSSILYSFGAMRTIGPVHPKSDSVEGDPEKTYHIFDAI
jgi:hypothetical protein